ncbi:MAG TPA: methyltransferase domain-containing protein [Gemmatimonadaceae bacterium]
MAASARNRLKFSLGSIDSFSGSTTHKRSVAHAVQYQNQIYDDCVRYGALTPDRIRERVVVELGPGDNIGALLRFIAAGARNVVGADRFYSTHDIEHERKIYIALRATLSDEERRRFDDAVQLEPTLHFNPERVSYVYGKGAQDIDAVVPPQSVDLVVSRGVLQEVYDIDRAFAAMDRILRPGGVMIHKIDLRDYGMFSSLGYHPREFLTIPNWAYWWMAYNTDKPNRRMLNYYREKMVSMKYDAEFYITGVVSNPYLAVQPEIIPHTKALVKGVDYTDEHQRLIDTIRPRLQPDFRSLRDDELIAAATMMVGRKPA